MEIKLGHIRLSIRVGWSTLEETPLLLGRMDVFDKLDIEFSEHSNTIALRPVFD